MLIQLFSPLTPEASVDDICTQDLSLSLSFSLCLSLSLSLSVSLCVSLSLTPFIFLLSSVSFVGFNLSLMLLYLSTAARSSIGALPPSLALCLFLSVLSRSRPLSLSLSFASRQFSCLKPGGYLLQRITAWKGPAFLLSTFFQRCAIA